MQEFMRDERDKQCTLSYLMDTDLYSKTDKTDAPEVEFRKCHKWGHYARDCTS